MFPRSTHETFAQKLYTTFKNNKRFAKPKLSRTDFTVVHYAGDVSLLHKMMSIFVYKKFLYVMLPIRRISVPYTGDIPGWSILRQEQRLCSGWASGSAECFFMPLCSWFIPSTPPGDSEVFKIFIHWITFQGGKFFLFVAYSNIILCCLTTTTTTT